MTDLNDLLVQFERKLKELKVTDELTSQAPTVFKQFADEVDRRTGGDRRSAQRPSPERRRHDNPPEHG